MSGLLLHFAWIVVLVPFVLSALIAVLGRRGAVAAPWIASVGPLLVLAVSGAALSAASSTAAVQQPWTSGLASQGSVAWVAAGGNAMRLGWAIDTLAAAMFAVVGLVALGVVVFSVGYMAGDRGWSRYFALLSLFTGSMALLVIADSFLTMFIGWELVGACSYLLIGFWYEKPAAAAAAVKAFLTTRVGDVALLLGLGVLWSSLGSLSYVGVSAGLQTVPSATLNIAAVLIAVGAMGKSAQFPLHAWLPDAMEGPTPVSALIHAATMVAAGVYLVVRVWPLFEAAPAARMVLLIAGAVSALGAAVVAVAQRDIKKVLAYSTVSQLGFMFAALGAGAWEAAFFHLLTHAAFKALLFLSSGSVIHGSGTQDLHAMGRLRATMPVTFAVWLVGVFALAGLPGFAGFFSKDAVLASVWHAYPVVGAMLFAAGGLTALYSARATRLAFFGKATHGTHAHESPLSMVVPLVALAIPAAALGWGASLLAGVLNVPHEPLSVGIATVATAIAVLGAVAGWASAGTPETESASVVRLAGVWTFLGAGYRWDALVDRVVVRSTVTACRALWAWADRFVVDGVVEGSAVLADATGSMLSRLQRGDAQAYSAAIALGVVAMLVATVWLVR